MPEVKFGKKNEPSLILHRNEDLIAVRTRSARSLREGPVPPAAAAELQDAQLVLAFPEAGVEVYEVPAEAGRRTPAERREALRQAPDVRFAGGVLVDEQTGEPVVYTENIFIKFIDQADPEECREVIRQAGLTIKEELTYATNAFFTASPEGAGMKVFEIALALLEREDVEYCHPEIVRRRARRAISTQQWHLKSVVVGNVNVNASANVEAAHQIAQGEAVTIAIIDDGVDIDHPEFAGFGKIVAPRDVTLTSNDPRPKDPDPFNPDNHGTACAGVACANGSNGASGVAPKARLVPIRLASGLGSQAEADAFIWAADHGADVISCSWGPPDGIWFNPNDPLHNAVQPLPASTKLAIDYATENGRGGKGCVVLFAAGNGNESVDNDGYASYERVIAVAACNDQGKRSVYSDFGRAVWCAFPSNDQGFPDINHPEPLTPGIWTTDRTGPRGYNPGRAQDGDANGNYTNRFGGTSSACPGAAGVVALALSVNPDLRWQEVRDLLRRACDRIDPQGGMYDANGHSKLYGYGRLNAAIAAQLARPARRNSLVVSRNFNQPLPDLQTVSVSLEVGEAEPVESLSAHIQILHTFIGDLLVTLVPPPSLGVPDIVLHNRAGGSTRNIKRAYDASVIPDMAALSGKSAQGVWTLMVQDAAMRDEGALTKFGLELTFASPARRDEIIPSDQPSRTRRGRVAAARRGK